jgi:hypothetical protein
MLVDNELAIMNAQAVVKAQQQMGRSQNNTLPAPFSMIA